MKLKILLEGHPTLKEISEPVEKVTPELHKLALDMCETMLLAKGIGLAAPQVNKKIRLIVYDTTNSEKNGSTGILFNPEILHGEGVCDSLEGCLSLPKKLVTVRRSSKIKIKYLNIYGETVIKELSGLAAIVVQHECDHLDGIVLSDYEE